MTEKALSIAIVSCHFEFDLRDPEALLIRYHTMACWARALVEAGAGRVSVIQRFHRDLVLRRDGVDYRFVVDGTGNSIPAWHPAPRLVRAVLAYDPAVVHVEGLISPILVRQLRLSLPGETAIVVQDHGGIHAGSPGFRAWRWRLLFRLGLRAADAFLFTSRELAAPWLEAGIIGPRQSIYEVQESSTDLATPSRLPDEAIPGLPGSPALLWVARLDENKDPLTIVNGFERFVELHPSAALTMVFSTEGLLPVLIRRIAESPRLHGRVNLLGLVKHGALADLYAAADFFVLGSHHEAACFSLIEALSFGVTPVVSDIAPFRVLTDGGRIGALFPVGDADAMSLALLRLAASGNSARRRELVRDHFLRNHSWSVVGHRALQAYLAAWVRRRESAP